MSGPHHVMWRGTTIKTGHRTLKVKLEREIPQSFNTLGAKTMVSVRYRDQPKTCFSCGATGHERRDCPTHDETTYVQAVVSPPTDAVAVAQTDAVENTPNVAVDTLSEDNPQTSSDSRGEKEGGKRRSKERWTHRSASPKTNGRTSRRPSRRQERARPRTVGCHRGHPLTSYRRNDQPYTDNANITDLNTEQRFKLS